MKLHTQKFKENISKLGRELDSIISYNNGTEVIELGNSELNSVTPVLQSSLLKSVMKELDIDSNVDIPLGTVVNYKFGVSLNGSEYEYLDYGNYIVYSSEKQEDTNSYNIVCYDKMLASMVEYDKLQTKIKTFPMTVRDYIDCICTDLGLYFKNANENFANSNRTIQGDLYAELGYTYRDILDELAQVTASNIVINYNDELEIRYITETNDTINEEYLKDVNVAFGEKYGPINTIVLSRSAESDNISQSIPEDLPDEEKIAIKIVDNQIMNFNDRSDYMPEILQKLVGLEYYINDFSSTGICYYDVCDRYNVQIGDEIYSCVMFNDQINITQGLEETIYTDLPEQAETDYTKSDKTDRKINQTYLIVDKQNQQIEATITKVDGQDEKISQVLQTVDEINQKISEQMDLTITKETFTGLLEMEDINQSEPITIRIRPRIESISYLYPHNGLYPSNTTYLKNRKILFKNTKTDEEFFYELPDDLLYYDVDNYDEFYLSLETQTCQVIKRCAYNADGTVRLLGNPQIKNITPYPLIELTEGDYEVSIVGYNNAYLYLTLMAQNIYTSQFATRTELRSNISQTNSKIESEVSQVDKKFDNEVRNLSSRITQTAGEINQEVAKKVGNNEIISKINQTPETITINASKLNLQGYITASDLSGSGTTTINGSNITTGTISANRVSGGTLQGTTIIATTGSIGGFELLSERLRSTNKLVGIASATYPGNPAFWAGGTDPFETSDWSSKTPFYVTNQGRLKATNADITGTITSSNATITGGTLNMPGASYNTPKIITSGTGKDGGSNMSRIYPDGIRVYSSNGTQISSLGIARRYANGRYYETGDMSLFSTFDDSTTSLSPDSIDIFGGGGGGTYITSSLIETPRLIQTSLATEKKNFEKFNNALSIIDDIDLYKYNLKNEKDTDKKHIGFIIGNDFKYSSEITAINKDGKEIGVDTYSMTSLCLQAIKEQQEIIKTQQKQIKELYDIIKKGE